VNILLIQRVLPGRFGDLAQALVERGDTCVMRHAAGDERDAPAGLRLIRALPVRGIAAGDPGRLRPLEAAVLDGEAAFRAARELAGTGFRPDAIIAQGGFGPCLHVAEAFRGVPVLGAFDGYGPDDPLRAQIRLELSACRQGMVGSRFHLSGFPRDLQPKLAVVDPGIDTDVWAPARGVTADRAALGLPADAELLVHCGSVFQEHRGCETVLAACAELQARRPRLHVWLVGEESGEFAAAPVDGRRRAATLAGLAALDRARLRVATGGGPELRRAVLRAADAVVHLCDGAGVSRSLIEAMACGAAIAGADTPPMREFLRDGENALLAPFADAVALAAAVARLLDDPVLAAGLGRAARRRAVLCHGVRRQSVRQIELLDALARIEFRRLRPGSRAEAGQSRAPNSA
jgi:glycosyltransferase involved in cell wall biosynthesis